MKDKTLAPLHAASMLPTVAEMYGGGERGRKIAAWVLEVEHELRPGTLNRQPPAPAAAPARVQPSKTESNPVPPCGEGGVA